MRKDRQSKPKIVMNHQKNMRLLKEGKAFKTRQPTTSKDLSKAIKFYFQKSDKNRKKELQNKKTKTRVNLPKKLLLFSVEVLKT